MSNNSLYLKLAPRLNKTTIVKGPISNGFEITVVAPTPVIEVITLRSYVTRPGTITALKNLKTGSGTVDISITVDGFLVVGSNITATTVPQNITLNWYLNIGSKIQLSINSVVGGSGLEFGLLGVNV